MSDFPEYLASQRKTLEQMKVGASVVQSLRYEALPDNFFYDSLLHTLTGYVLKEHLVTETYVGERVHRTPATSWQMFKWEHAESWWLGWLVKRKPIRFAENLVHVTVDVERSFTYPEANIVTDLGRPLIFERLTER